MKILVVEDDAKLQQLLRRVLQEEGHVVDSCSSGADALAQAALPIYDLLLLDWMLPDLDGLSVCRQLRQTGSTMPILMLTARGEVSERVLGLQTGADDYVVKPFELDELLARIHALLRRSGGLGRLVLGPLEIDREHRKVVSRGSALDLTTREYELLLHLARRAGQVVTRSELLQRVWETGFDASSNFVDVHISRLREKLGRHAAMIETVRGAGYRLVADAPAAP